MIYYYLFIWIISQHLILSMRVFLDILKNTIVNKCINFYQNKILKIHILNSFYKSSLKSKIQHELTFYSSLTKLK